MPINGASPSTSGGKREAPLLSVIVPVYNVEQFVLACMESIASQRLDEMEVIVVDDGSTDGSGALCDEFASKDRRFRVIHQPNKGISAARNTGIREAKGDYLMFVDSDDFLVPDSLAAVVDCARGHRLDFLGFGNTSAPESPNEANVEQQPQPRDIKVLSGFDYIAERNYSTTVWWYLIKRDIVVAHSILFPEGRMIEDAGYNLRLLLKSHRVADVPNTVYCYRNRHSSIMHSKSREHQTALLDDYVDAAKRVETIIAKSHEKLSQPALVRCRSQRDSYVFFGAIRALKLGVASDFIGKAKEQGVYPFERMSRLDYPDIKYSILHYCINTPALWKLMSKAYAMARPQSRASSYRYTTAPNTSKGVFFLFMRKASTKKRLR